MKETHGNGLTETHGTGLRLAAQEIIRWLVGFAVSLAVLGLCTVLYGHSVNSNTSDALKNAKDGTYTATAQGFGGEITAEVTISSGRITNVVLTGDHETPGLGAVAIEKMPSRIVAAQSLNVDGVSGATVSSNAIRQAVTDALAQAGVNADELTGEVSKEDVVKTEETMDVDVVVVGAGGAGMTAAITAKQAGKNVVILEKMPYVGGNTTKASGGMNAAGTKNQEAALAAETDPKVKESLEGSTVENFIADTIKSGHDLNNPDLVRTMAENSSDAVEWLESIGAPLPKIAATGSTVHMYLHEPEDGSAVGEYLVQSYTRVLEELDIPVLLDTKATELISDNGKVVGVKAEGEDKLYTINAKAVILATGGFGANEEMYCSFRPDLKGTVTTNAPGATGDGIVMAQAMGADLVDIEQIQLHPTVFQKDGMLVSERVRSNGAILVNENGQRFVNDLLGRDIVSGAELEQPNCNIFIVYDSQFVEEKLYQKYDKLGMPVQGNTLEELAAAMGFDADATANFVETVAKWNAAVAGEAEDEFGRNNGLISLTEAPFYAINIAPGIHHTMGGIKIDTETHVINTNGEIIPGLFAAGEVTGGVHGGNRVGGNAVADIVVFGRIAGANASAYVDENTVALADAPDGTYSATANGFGGDITVTVTLAGGKIADVQIVGDSETEGLGSVAVAKMPAQLLKAQSLNVDGVSGATVSSNAIRKAFTSALAQAGVDANALVSSANDGPVVKTEETMDVDVVVVGAGGAGMTAAITAKQAGKNVVILEKMPYVGGNTTKASGGMNAAGTKNQEAALAAETDPKVKESLEGSTVENFIADTIKSGHDLNNPDLVRTMAENSSDAVEWLESIGAPLPKIAATGSTVHMYLHEPEDGSAVGEYLVQSYTRVLDELDIPVLLDTKATELISDNGKVVGVKAEGEDKLYTINAKAVILATGGFGANEEMYCSFRPDLKGTVTTNAPGATGDGIVMAQALGADLVDIEQIQLHPTVFQKDGMLVSERVRSNGAILVNENGQRFVNDLLGRDIVSGAELEQPNCNIFIVYDSQFVEEKLYQKYDKLGMPVQGNTLEELAAAMGFDADATANFVETVAKWNAAVAGEAEDEFGRNNGLISLDKGPFYAINIAPGIHHTMGGIKIDTETHVINTNGDIIPGLFAAGEVTGGVHGGNRVGGNAVADIVVFGRIAGANASAYADNQ